MGKVVIKILQGSAVTQIMLGGLTIYPPVANFLQCICAKNYENWLAVDKVITKMIRLTFFGPPCMFLLYFVKTSNDFSILPIKARVAVMI